MCVCFLRLQHEVSVLQQQLCESRSLVHSLQCELQVYHRVCGVTTNPHSGNSCSLNFQSFTSVSLLWELWDIQGHDNARITSQLCFVTPPKPVIKTSNC